ncbi:MAG: DUF429 domain-containing protein [Nitrososphaerales archaeon]
MNAGTSVGIDLAGVETRSTGAALIDTLTKQLVRHTVLHSDIEILDFISRCEPVFVVVVDAPLSLPKGRESLEIRSNIHFRECDRELARRHLKFFPITLGPMRKLTARGIKLAAILRSQKYLVYEGYPGAAQDILKIPRKGAGVQGLAEGLRSLGLEFSKSATHDELDAITCAYIGLMHFTSRSELIGREEEGQILLPRLTNS